MKYEIRLKREIWNNLLHIIVGGALAFVFIPTSILIVSVSVLGVAAIVREVLQSKVRGKKQPMYIHILDVLGFMFGAAIWVYIREKRKIKPDEL